MDTTPKRSPETAAVSLKERRAENARKARAQGEALRRIASIERSSAAISVLERMILDGGRLRFGSLADVLLPHPWAVDQDGRLLGHLLLVNDEIFEAGDPVALSLEEALMEDWADLNQHERFTAAYVGALNGAIAQAQSQHKRLRLMAEVNKYSRDDDRSGTIRDL